MPTTADCEQWLADLRIESDDTVYSLYNTVSDEEACGDFQCTNRGKELLIRPSGSKQWLMIASEPARENFLLLLKTRYCGGEDVHAWYMRRGGSMSKTG